LGLRRIALVLFLAVRADRFRPFLARSGRSSCNHFPLLRSAIAAVGPRRPQGLGSAITTSLAVKGGTAQGSSSLGGRLGGVLAVYTSVSYRRRQAQDCCLSRDVVAGCCALGRKSLD
jgi:hypothetical protein